MIRVLILALSLTWLCVPESHNASPDGASVSLSVKREGSSLCHPSPSPGTCLRGSLEQTHSQCSVVSMQASVLSLRKQFRVGGQAVWRNANSSQCWSEPNAFRKATLQATMIIFCIPEPKGRTQENCHQMPCVIQAQLPLSLLEPWRPGPGALLPWLWPWAHPDVRGTGALVAVQAMWSPFQGSPALPQRWTAVLKPKQNLEQVDRGTTAPFLFQNCRLRELTP